MHFLSNPYLKSTRVITKEHEIKKFPTIKYYRNGYWGKYEGHRNLKELLELTERLLQPITQEVKRYCFLSLLFNFSFFLLYHLNENIYIYILFTQLSNLYFFFK